jgi:cell division protein FtsN
VLQGYIPQPKQTAEVKETLPIPNKSGADDKAGILDGNKGKAVSKKPRYDFYTVLEEVEVAVPEKELRQQAKTEAKQPAAKTAMTSKSSGKGNYIIQVGSFRNPKDAESMKAQLAFLGASAHIQKVTINDKTWQRVRVGPYSSASEVEAMRKRLSNSSIDSRVYQVK